MKPGFSTASSSHSPKILEGKVHPEQSGDAFLDAVRKYSGQSNQQGALRTSGATTEAASREAIG